MMFADMDESLRHLGIGELSIGKQIKRLAGYFYARLRALTTPLRPCRRARSHRCCAPTCITAA